MIFLNKQKVILGTFLIYITTSFGFAADITQDILSYHMSAYIHQILELKKQDLEEYYKSHSTQFNAQKRSEIAQPLEEMQKKWEAEALLIQQKAEQLNKSIADYNQSVEEFNALQSRLQNIQDTLNKAIQELKKQDEIKRNIATYINEINQESLRLNQKLDGILNLEDQFIQLYDFYASREYEKDPHILKLKEELNKWKLEQENKLQALIEDYTTLSSQFRQWKDIESNLIYSRRKYIQDQDEYLKGFVKETNQLIAEYNDEVQRTCFSVECEQNLLAKKNQIQEMRKNAREKTQSLEEALSDLNKKEHWYNEIYSSYLQSLDDKGKKTQDFSQVMIIELENKRKILAQEIQKKANIAKQKWLKAQEELNAYKSELALDYGDSFELSIEYFSRWILSKAYTIPEEISSAYLLKLDNETKIFCDYSLEQKEAEKLNSVCSLMNKTSELFKGLNNQPKLDYTATLKQKKETQNALIALENKLEEWKTENTQNKAQLLEQLAKHNQQTINSETSYNDFIKNQSLELQKAVEKIKRIYELKNALLEAEYKLLNSILNSLNEKPQGVAYQKALKQFRSAFENDNPSQKEEFPDHFYHDPHELFSIVAKNNNWKRAFNQVRKLTADSSLPLKGEDKKQVMLRWLNSSFIDDILDQITHRLQNSGLSEEQVLSEMNISLFLRNLFLESVYIAIPIYFVKNKQTENNGYLVHSHDRVFWILNTGQLQQPKDIYQ